MKDRCIYKGGDVVVWPYGYSLSRKNGKVRIHDERGKVVARVGDRVRMGGGQITQSEAGPTPKAARRTFREKRKVLGVPKQCRGPLWMAAPGVCRVGEKGCLER